MLKLLHMFSLFLTGLCLQETSLASANVPVIEEVDIASERNPNEGALRANINDVDLQSTIKSVLTKAENDKVRFCICKGIVVVIGNLTKEEKDDVVGKIERIEGCVKVFYEEASIDLRNTVDDVGTKKTAFFKKEFLTPGSEINSSDYTITSVGESTYICGKPSSENERKRIIDVAKKSGTKNVKLYLVKNINR